MNLLNRILAAAQIGETTDWEFKSARGGFPGSFWETYSAMANSEGGTVVLGASERDDEVRLDGLSDSLVAQHQKRLWDGLNDRGQVSLNLLEPNLVEIVDLEAAKLLVIRVPRASRTQRPVYLGGNPLGHTWRRRHEGDYRCGDGEVRRMLADADETPRDHRIPRGFALNDLDASSLAQYRRRFQLAKGEDHPWAALPDVEFLTRLGGWRCDRSAGSEGLTLAGILMFGKDLALRDPEVAPNYFVDYREKLDPSTRWSDRIYPDGTWEPNLFQFYVRVWPKLAAGIPTPFRLEGDQRRDVTPTHEALREAFVNALIHADYSGAGGIVVERHPNRFFVSNPGTLLVSLEQYHRGGVSECRNPSLQQMFLLIGGGERAGSGADRIRAGWRHQHWRAPRIEVFDQPDRVGLSLPTASLIPEETLHSLRQRFGPVISSLGSAELQALATAALEDAVSNSRLQQLLTDHPVDITRMLTGLCERGLLVSDSRRRWTTYRLPPAGDSGHSLFPADGSAQLPGDSTHLPADSAHLPADSAHLPADSARSDEAEEALQRIADPVAQRGKVPADLMESTLYALCTGRFLTAEDLARLLRRTAPNLRSRYLTPMVRDGRLRLRFPEATNRPDQAYTAGEEPE
ncbi:hypothetical protein FJ251_09935 [bacterium]|nr:hypothetical protein [bacterium]